MIEIAFLLEKDAWPKKTSTPNAFERRSAESFSETYALISCNLVITLSKFTLIYPSISIPYSLEVLQACITFADFKKALEGTQPVFKQSPPKKPRSINATLAPDPAARVDVTSPPAPPPITIISYLPTYKN